MTVQETYLDREVVDGAAPHLGSLPDGRGLVGALETGDSFAQEGDLSLLLLHLLPLRLYSIVREFLPPQNVRQPAGVLAGRSLPSSSVRSCTARSRPIEVAVAVAVAVAAAAAVVAGDIAGNPGEVAGTWFSSKLFCLLADPALHPGLGHPDTRWRLYTPPTIAMITADDTSQALPTMTRGYGHRDSCCRSAPIRSTLSILFQSQYS
jgi:hypothetical protein